MVYKRVEGLQDHMWTNHIKAVLNYNNKQVTRATGFTPSDGKMPKHKVENRIRMLMNAKRKNKFQRVSVDDKVKLFRKKDKMDKERTSVWSKDLHTVEKIINQDGPTSDKIKGYDRPFVRSDLLLMDN